MWNLKKPCNECPFRKDCPKGWLGKSRATEIVRGMIDSPHASFSCHKTTVSTEDGWDRVETEDTQHCAGAAIPLHKTQNPNMAMRFGYAFGEFDGAKLQEQESILETPEEFIERHTSRSEK